MNFANFILGRTNDKPCRWCKKKLATRGGPDSDFPELCALCCTSAVTPNLVTRLCEEFPREAKRWVKRMKTMPTRTDFTQDQLEATGDMLAVQRRLYESIRDGKTGEAQALQAEVTTKQKAIAHYVRSVPEMMSALDGEGEK